MVYLGQFVPSKHQLTKIILDCMICVYKVSSNFNNFNCLCLSKIGDDSVTFKARNIINNFVYFYIDDCEERLLLFFDQ